MHYERYEWIAGILFQQMDVDGDDFVSLDEFVEAYFVEQRRLGEEIEELNLRISDAETRASQIEKKIIEMRPKEKKTKNRHLRFNQHFIMKGSLLSIHVIDGRELKAKEKGRVPNPQVRLSIEGQSGRTMEVFGNSQPVWNENLHFDIHTGVDKLKVEVNDVYPDKLNKKERIGFCEIDLATLSEEPNEID